MLSVSDGGVECRSFHNKCLRDWTPGTSPRNVHISSVVTQVLWPVYETVSMGSMIPKCRCSNVVCPFKGTNYVNKSRIFRPLKMKVMPWSTFWYQLTLWRRVISQKGIHTSVWLSYSHYWVVTGTEFERYSEVSGSLWQPVLCGTRYWVITDIVCQPLLSGNRYCVAPVLSGKRYCAVTGTVATGVEWWRFWVVTAIEW